MSQPTATQGGRPPAFTFRRSREGWFGQSSGEAVLHCDQVPLPRLAEKFGTPLYVYSASTLRDRLRTFDHAFRKFPHTICYSVKANSNLAVLRVLARLGCGFDVVSGGELERVMRVERSAAKKVVFSGVGKTPEEMDAALRAGILMFNVESEDELWMLATRAARIKKTARFALRVNPDVPADTHPYISTGLHQHKFGVPIKEARALYARALATRYLEVSGVSVHIGSQITSVDPFGAALERVAELVRQLHRDGHRIRYVDAGGGLGIAYNHEAALPRFDEYAAAYAAAVARPLRGLKVHLLLEPGRILVAPAGALLTTVLYCKKNDGKRFLVVDAAMNDLLRPSLYNAYHEIVPVAAAESWGPASWQQEFDVVGPICESGDFLARKRRLLPAGNGELLAILDTGAYGMVLASNYNSRPRPAEVLVDGKSVRLIRRRETTADLLRAENP